MADSQMIINYVPGEECRVAIVEDGKLEEYYVERFASASRVGNIYAGKVANVEAAIQAAFVNFGVEDNGFLHVSDLHPRYFPGEDGDTTERVGLKTPRRERPPIQASLRRSDEVIVQVLKEGVGTKGPTLTSYLSIPGRFLVMMPHMEKSGVSRKVEDEDQRRKMREILDQLDLPEGFGFIVRTAGMDRTKAELKRDLAYLMRLWKDMERGLKAGGKPRLLYSESDLLVRCLRDVLSQDIKEVIIDNEVALKRAARFMKIVSPRGQARLLHYPGPTPVFHAFGVEQQIALINAREVPLPSGGRLVIDQTEALVAIDVNSGKSRESRDSETNAYQTNLEAVDEICRQLRLRDMGGIVINDLIDMRSAQHRKDIEQRFRERLKRDRARSTVIPISEFGILEMTRQRMRASHESVHFADCPTCRGRGMVQRPDSVASDALRELTAILNAEKVAKVEMVVAPRVAGELLSTKRLLLNRVERASGKHVDVRVSETHAVDRVTFYAYDAQGADVDPMSLARPKKPKDLVAWAIEGEENWAMDEEAEKAAAAEPEPIETMEEDVKLHPIEIDEPLGEEEAMAPSPGGEEGGRRRRRRRRGRGGRGEGGRADGGRPSQGSPQGASHARAAQPAPHAAPLPTTPPPLPRASAPQAGGVMAFAGDHGDADESGGTENVGAPGEASHADEPGQADGPGHAGEGAQAVGEGGGRRRRRRRRGRGGRGGGPGQGGDPNAAPMGDGQPRPPREQARPAESGPAGNGTDEGRQDASRPDVSRPESGGEGGEGGRRRRRRRRGRGGRGGGLAGGGQSGGQSGGQGGGQGGGQPSVQNTGSSGGSPPATNPATRPTSDAPVSRPRALYSNVRRRLTTAELNKRPKPE